MANKKKAIKKKTTVKKSPKARAVRMTPAKQAELMDLSALTHFNDVISAHAGKRWIELWREEENDATGQESRVSYRRADIAKFGGTEATKDRLRIKRLEQSPLFEEVVHVKKLTTIRIEKLNDMGFELR